MLPATKINASRGSRFSLNLAKSRSAFIGVVVPFLHGRIPSISQGLIVPRSAGTAGQPLQAATGIYLRIDGQPAQDADRHCFTACARSVRMPGYSRLVDAVARAIAGM